MFAYGHGSLSACASRTADFVARYGGEECIVLLANAALDDAHRVVELIRASVEALGVEHTSSSAANLLTLGLELAEEPFPT